MSKNSVQIVRGGLVVDALRGTAQHRDILVIGDQIKEVGAPGFDAPVEAKVLDANDKLVLPGLVNGHTHGHGSLGRGRGDRWTLELLLNAGPWISGKRTLEDKRLAARLNAAEQVLKGCTACYDLYFEFPTPSVDGMKAVVDGYDDVGMRAVIAPMVADKSLYEAVPGLLDALPDDLRAAALKLRLDPYEVTMSALRSLVANWNVDPAKFSLALAPTIAHHCSEPFLIACRDLAWNHGLGLHMHLAESKLQAVASQKLLGMSPAAYLEKLRILGPKMVGAHCVWVDDDDIRRFASAGAAITHQPGCNLRIGSGIAPVRKFLDAGIPVGIGTDGSNSSDNQNMFEATRCAANVSRIVDADPARWISTQEALSLATAGGARLIGRDSDLGQIKAGFLADLVFLDLGHVNYIPLNDPINQIVNCEDSSAVETVMIAGKLVVENGQLTNFDLESLRSEVNSAMERLDAETADNRDLVGKLAPLVGSYCGGLAGCDHSVKRTLY